MNELTPIRQWLLSSRGRWSRIARQADLSTKTVQRIAHGHVASVNLTTYSKLKALMDGASIEAKKVA
ncbi:hypothetical protein [Burkholderia gladioli]|uniref:XRE family transcriptional regulator n=1 Tax=Burkholderia gladioli TaxID=28095 RepID=A0AB38TLY6_BURGA|nr:hypothetical protein [Burkholderia gladioli]UWX68847.1 hypothetical protein NYZ96_11420 [Burkholderia gladioli]